MSRLCAILSLALATFCGSGFPSVAHATPEKHPQPLSGPFETPLTDAAIDNSTMADWVSGNERPLQNPDSLRQLIWTQTFLPSGGVFQFGAEASGNPHPGTRHLRIGFKSALPVGSILVRGDGAVSVLRPSAPYPGNLADESQWEPAKRIVNRQVVVDPVDSQSYALWVLPPGVRTRALRFTHISVATDSNFAGVFGGMYLLAGRYANVAPQARVFTSTNQPAAHLLTDEQYNNWTTWDNGPAFSHPVTTTAPEWIDLEWSQPVRLVGLAALWAGFNAADTQIFAGPESIDPQNAPESDWKSIGHPDTLNNQYPRALGIDWMDFGKPVTTRAIRLRMTAVTDEAHHNHLSGKTRNGTRVWLGELMALEPLDPELRDPGRQTSASIQQSGQPQDLQAAILPAPADSLPHPPIPIHFTLDAAGYVTLVIDDAHGNRVRNLISNTHFDKGPNTVWWDGTDDLGRNSDAANHGVYLVPTHFVSSGSYKVRGIVHSDIDLRYEFSVYNAGHPAWETVDGKGGWLTNHTAPQATLFVPADQAPGGKPLVFIGSSVSEGGAGLAWVDLNGVKQGGRGWIGGAWTSAPFLARDAGPRANTSNFAYVGAPTGGGQAGSKILGAIRLTGLGALTDRGDKPILNYTFDPGTRLVIGTDGRPDWNPQMGGLAAHNDMLIVSMTLLDQLIFVDAAAGRAIGTLPTKHPTGVAFDAQGRLLVLSGNSLLRYSLPPSPQELADAVKTQKLPQPDQVIAEGLDDPKGLTTDSIGNIYIATSGDSNQVRVYNPSGKLLHTIGHSGPSQAGPYDPLHMNNPTGLAIDSNNHLWVAENDFQPKRVSVWALDAKLDSHPDSQMIHAFYGPSEYGGGGSLDPQDKTKFYYHGMEFKLDWSAGTDSIESVLYRPSPEDIQLPRFGSPNTVLYSNGHRYFINSYLNHPIVGVSIGVLYLDSGGVIRPVAAMGKANDWPLLRSDAFRSMLPPGADLTSNAADKSMLFTWSDLNDNGKVDPEEVHLLPSSTGSIVIMSDKDAGTGTAHGPVFLNAFVNGKAVMYEPQRVSPSGVPVYDLNKSTVIANGTQWPASDGQGQVLYSPSSVVLTTAPLPFARESIGGVNRQGNEWSYPSLWPGLHPSHSAPLPDSPGEIIGATRLLGGFVAPRDSNAGQVWAINGNQGNMYLFTADGLFIAQLFQDFRVGKPWTLPYAPRNTLLNDLTLGGENFFPSMTQTSDGNIYLVDGSRTSIVRIDGLNTLRKLDVAPMEVTADELREAQAFLKQREASRQRVFGPQTLDVKIQTGPQPQLKDLSAYLQSAQWATVDSRITQIGWNRKSDVVQAAITVSGDRLFADFRTNETNLLANSGAVTNAPFKTGGALDLMIGTDPKADPKRAKPVVGDIRLLVYQVNGKTKALLYRAVVPGTVNPVPFSSPSQTITLDQVQDVSDQMQLDSANGNYAFSIPLKTLGLIPVAGQTLKADIGILRGNGTQTNQRAYWSNKATGITSDVPSEAELTPELWGTWVFR